MFDPTEIHYCDHCGEPLSEQRQAQSFSELPFDVDSANKGESGLVCLECIELLTKESDNA